MQREILAAHREEPKRREVVSMANIAHLHDEMLERELRILEMA